MDARDNKLEELFKKYDIDTVVHLAFVLNPIHNREEMRDINVNGAKNVLNACKNTRVEKIIITSSTMVYGAWPDNPKFLTEDSPLRGHPTYYYNQDKIEVEKLCRKFAEKNPEVVMTILRPCLVLGPTVNHFYARLLNWPVLPLVDGENPDMQFLHEDDLAKAYELFILKDLPGTFNLVGNGTMKWKEVIEKAGKKAVKLPRKLLYSALSLFWHLRLTEFPPQIIDFIKYRWVASGEKAKKVGFKPKYSTKEAFLDFLKNNKFIKKKARYLIKI